MLHMSATVTKNMASHRHTIQLTHSTAPHLYYPAEEQLLLQSKPALVANANGQPRKKAFMQFDHVAACGMQTAKARIQTPSALARFLLSVFRLSFSSPGTGNQPRWRACLTCSQGAGWAMLGTTLYAMSIQVCFGASAGDCLLVDLSGMHSDGLHAAGVFVGGLNQFHIAVVSVLGLSMPEKAAAVIKT